MNRIFKFIFFKYYFHFWDLHETWDAYYTPNPCTIQFKSIYIGLTSKPKDNVKNFIWISLFNTKLLYKNI